MTKRMIIGIMIIFSIPIISYAEDSSRIDELEKQIQELKMRVSKLELVILQEKEVSDYSDSQDGWKSKTNWRKLATGMGTNDVKEILGEPQRVDGGNMMIWYYENSGRVIFFDDKVDSWSEPR